MAKADKIVAAGRTYSVVLLTLTVAMAALSATEFGRWLLLGQARAAMSQWIVADFITEDLEDWWQRQQIERQKVTDTFTLSADLRTGRERYYSGFGSAIVRTDGSTWSVSVRQPVQLATLPKDLPEVPDVRAKIPDLLLWTRKIDFSDLTKKILAPLSDTDAAIENGRLGLNQAFKESHPEVTEKLPALLKNDMSVDNRWLSLGSEKDKATFQLQEIARSARVVVAKDSFPPAVYRDVERAITTSIVKVPVIDIEMPTQNALWVLSLLVFLNCLVLQVTLERLKDENVQEREELWLLMDAKPGLSRVLSTMWLTITLAAPIAAPTVVLINVLVRTKAGTTNSMGAVAMGIPLLLLIAGGAWSSARILTMLRAIMLPKPTPPAAISVADKPKADELAKGESRSSKSATA